MPGVNYYNPDDVTTHFKRASKTPKAPKGRPSVTPGKVVILLAGRFKGRRVVVLSRLESGLLLVTGPYKVNGVPLRRVNEAYVQPTSTVLDVKKVNMKGLDDSYFKKVSVSKDMSKTTPWRSIDKSVTEEDVKRMQAKKERQATVDAVLVAQIKKTNMLARYLSRRFSLRKGDCPHDMNF